jgi:hypothetical protein
MSNGAGHGSGSDESQVPEPEPITDPVVLATQLGAKGLYSFLEGGAEGNNPTALPDPWPVPIVTDAFDWLPNQISGGAAPALNLLYNASRTYELRDSVTRTGHMKRTLVLGNVRGATLRMASDPGFDNATAVWIGWWENLVSQASSQQEYVYQHVYQGGDTSAPDFGMVSKTNFDTNYRWGLSDDNVSQPGIDQNAIIVGGPRPNGDLFMIVTQLDRRLGEVDAPNYTYMNVSRVSEAGVYTGVGESESGDWLTPSHNRKGLELYAQQSNNWKIAHAAVVLFDEHPTDVELAALFDAFKVNGGLAG